MENKKLYVGNLNYSVTFGELKDLFNDIAPVEYVKIIEGKGFGFVDMETLEGAEKVKEELDGKEFNGRALRINEARPREPRKDF